MTTDKEERNYQAFMNELEKLSKKYGIGISGCGVFDYWDEPDEFFVFERKNNFIIIKYYEKIFSLGKQNSNIYEINLIAETSVPEDFFFSKLKEKVNEFWDEVESLNPILKGYIDKFKI